MNAFSKQQTPETISENLENWNRIFSVSNEQAEVNRKEYQAEKTRKYKISLIRAWRTKQRD